VAVGFFAQAIDGALGMAYGVTATTFLLGAGASPAAASAAVHIAEIFTTGFSGVSHLKYGNVDRRLFLRLLVPGISGAVLGSVVITQIDATVLKPYVSAYLLVMGVYILRKAFRKWRPRVGEPRHVGKLAALGGFVDAAGGGGWGPVVTSTLVGSGRDPRTTRIGELCRVLHRPGYRGVVLAARRPRRLGAGRRAGGGRVVCRAVRGAPLPAAARPNAAHSGGDPDCGPQRL
jgi:uncharacterized membrane protein YfcA